MCGINGIFAYSDNAPNVDPAELTRTRDHMIPRGPDGFGAWYSKNGRVGLGHRRLAIIDLSETGAQPMASADARLHVTFNGEIYNYQELRNELAAQGVAFRSHSDTEVLLHLYRRDGPQMVLRLRGMFAFAIWDEEKRSLFLARDRYGIKPLYYADDGRTFRFASQTKALMAGGAIATGVNSAGLVGFLLWGSVPEPFTIFEGVSMLPAGHTLLVTPSGAARPTVYWDISEAIHRSIALAAQVPAGQEREHVHAALLDSARHHMVADVPVGAFLSAGLDSATVVALSQKISPRPLRTVTLAFEEFKNKPADELPIAKEIANYLGTQHEAVTVSSQEMETELTAFFEAMDQPTVDGINTWFVSRAASQVGLKVALSGLGGDELLGGYRSFHEVPRRIAKYGAIAQTPFLSNALQAGHAYLASHFRAFNPRLSGEYTMSSTYEGAYQVQKALFMPWDLPAIIDGQVAREGLARLKEMECENRSKLAYQLSGFGKLVELESTRYMRNQLLRDTDWVGMAHSLEIRVPLVDHVLLEQVVGLAATGRLGEGKSILSTNLPNSALQRPKTGFTVPIWKWLRNSSELDAWKHVRILRHPKRRDYSRWAYMVLWHAPALRGLLIRR